MYAIQCDSFDGCKITIPISLESRPSLRYISTLFNPKQRRLVEFFAIDVQFFLNFIYE